MQIIECGEGYTNITGTCDLLNQDCENNEHCDVNTNANPPTTLCKPQKDGLGPKGEECGSTKECKSGLRCVLGHCSPYCCPSNHEPCAGGICDVQVSFPNEGWVMMCSYLPACTLFESNCEEGTYCHIGIAEQGLAVCDPPSDNLQEEGGVCEFRNDCKESAICNKNAPDGNGKLGICRHLCDTAKGGEPEKGGCLPKRACEEIKAGVFTDLGICKPTG